MMEEREFCRDKLIRSDKAVPDYSSCSAVRVLVQTMNIGSLRRRNVMARNTVQFQKGLSEPAFESLYGTEEQCRAVVVASPALSAWVKGSFSDNGYANLENGMMRCLRACAGVPLPTPFRPLSI
jgi:hypothetical protein